jgi:hypothetical protein
VGIVQDDLDEVVYAAIVGVLKSSKRDRVAAPAPGHAVEVPVEVARFRHQWQVRDLAWKRAVVARLLERIVIHPGEPPRQARGDPGRVELVWRL